MFGMSVRDMKHLPCFRGTFEAHSIHHRLPNIQLNEVFDTQSLTTSRQVTYIHQGFWRLC